MNSRLVEQTYQQTSAIKLGQQQACVLALAIFVKVANQFTGEGIGIGTSCPGAFDDLCRRGIIRTLPANLGEWREGEMLLAPILRGLNAHRIVELLTARCFADGPLAAPTGLILQE